MTGLDTDHRPRRDFAKTRAEVLTHPLRVRLLEIANERDISAVSFVRGKYADGLLGYMSESDAISFVSYHLRRLERRDCVEIVSENPRRGSVENVYRGVARAYFTDEDWEKVNPDLRKEITGVVLQGLLARAESAILEGTFDSRDNRWLVWVQMDLDEQGWSDLSELCQGTMDSVEALRNEVEERLASADEATDTSPITWGMLSFESPRPS
jgi:hypothetical protein